MKELLIKYPKAAKVVKDYYLEKFLKSLDDKNLPEDFKEHCRQQGLQEGMIEEVLELNCRALFDVFDENEIIIEILNNRTFLPPQFYYRVNSIGEREFHDKRVDAEKLAIQEAFSILEAKL